MFSCKTKTEQTNFFTENTFYVSTISWDISNLATFGSGEIRYFGNSDTLKIFCNSFLKNKDSITWGEPGIILKSGRWKKENNTIICEYSTIYRTFMLPNDKETIDRDSLIIDKTSLKNNKLIFNSNQNISKELEIFIKQNWSKLK